MTPSRWMRWLYVLDAALLLTHEIDSAYWHEWALFRLGGPELFVAVHIPLAALVVWGYGRLVEGDPWGDRVAVLVALIGFGALFIHGAFIAAGSAAFRTPLSLGIIGAMAACSVALGAFALPRVATSCPLRMRFGRRRA